MEYKQIHPEFPLDSAWSDPEKREDFIQKVSEFAFGADTIERGFSMEDVLIRLSCHSSFYLELDDD